MRDVAVSYCNELVSHFMEDEPGEGCDERPGNNGEINPCAGKIVVKFPDGNCNGDNNPCY